MKIEEIKYFRPDGKDRQPNGVCYYNAAMYKAIEDNEKSFICQPLTESFLSEKVADEQYGFSKYKGGMIVFALTINAIIDDIEKNKLKASLKKIYYSVMNHVFKDKKIDNLVKNWNKEFKDIDDMYLGAMTVGNNFKGKYQSGNQIYNDKSTSLELGGVPSELLLLFAIQLCKEFKQETVLVKDFNTNRIFLVDSEGIAGKTPQDKIVNASQELEKTKNLNTSIQKENVEPLEEMARLNRIKHHLDSNEEICLISACRGEKTPKENINATRSLANALKSLGYSFIQVNGGYTENKGLPNEQDVLESSFFVINNGNKDTFDQDMLWLCKKYDQETILLRSNKYVSGWYDFQGNMMSKPLTKFSIHDIENGFTKVHGSKFSLISESIEFEKSALQKPNVARFVAGKWLRKLIESGEYDW